MTAPIIDFSGPSWFLSNFYVDPDGHCLEYAYQALKSTDPAEREWVMSAPDPRTAKRRGRRLRHLRPGWDGLKVDAMRRLLVDKFSRPHLAAALLATGDAELVEGNWWGDRFWGQCPVGTGENQLGRLLMELRDKIRQGTTRQNSEDGTNGQE